MLQIISLPDLSIDIIKSEEQILSRYDVTSKLIERQICEIPINNHDHAICLFDIFKIETIQVFDSCWKLKLTDYSVVEMKYLESIYDVWIRKTNREFGDMDEFGALIEFQGILKEHYAQDIFAILR